MNLFSIIKKHNAFSLLLLFLVSIILTLSFLLLQQMRHSITISVVDPNFNEWSKVRSRVLPTSLDQWTQGQIYEDSKKVNLAFGTLALSETNNSLLNVFDWETLAKEDHLDAQILSIQRYQSQLSECLTILGYFTKARFESKLTQHFKNPGSAAISVKMYQTYFLGPKEKMRVVTEKEQALCNHLESLYQVMKENRVAWSYDKEKQQLQIHDEPTLAQFNQYSQAIQQASKDLEEARISLVND